MKTTRLTKDILFRKVYTHNEIRNLVWKSTLFYLVNSNLSCIVLRHAFLKWHNHFFKTRIKNFCIVSGRPRSIFRKFRISRIVLRDLGSQGLFFGLKKSSW